MIVDKKCLWASCLHPLNVLLSANYNGEVTLLLYKSQKTTEIPLELLWFRFLLLIGNNADDSIDSTFHGF